MEVGGHGRTSIRFRNGDAPSARQGAEGARKPRDTEDAALKDPVPRLVLTEEGLDARGGEAAHEGPVLLVPAAATVHGAFLHGEVRIDSLARDRLWCRLNAVGSVGPARSHEGFPALLLLVVNVLLINPVKVFIIFLILRLLLILNSTSVTAPRSKATKAREAAERPAS